MNRAALILIPAAALLASAGTQPAAARSKAFCRDYAQEMADRSAGSGPAIADNTQESGNAMPAAALDEQGGITHGTLTAASSGTPSADPAASDHWQHVYRRAYADCRAS